MSNSEEAWEDYCALVWCCNSLSAVGGRLRHSDNKSDNLVADYLERAQTVICFYVDERRKKHDPNNAI